FGEGQNIGLAAYYPFTAYWVTVDGELDSNIPVITIAPGSFTDYKGKVILKMADDSALSEATLSKFVVPADSGGIQWIIDAEGKLVRKAATGTGTVTTDNNVLSIALKYEDDTVNTNEVYMIKAALESDTPVLPLQRRISITVKDADGNDVSDATVTAKILYHGNEVSPSYYSYEEGYFSVNPSMPLLNSDGCQLYVTATKETITSSQTFDVGFGCFFYGDITNDSESLASFITNAAEVSAPLYMKVTDSGNNIEDFFGRISSLSNVYLDLFELTYITNFNSEIFISECPGIVSLSLPNSTTTISESAFTKTPNLAYIMIPASVTTISSGAFPSPNVIQKITLADGIAGFSLASNGAILVSSSGEILCVANGAKNSITTLDFSAAPLSSVTEIPANAFIGLASLTSITSFGNVTTIGDYAFAVSKLSGTVDLSKVQNIGQLAFARTKISGVTLNETDETTIAKQAFAYSEISSVTLPATTKFTPTEVDESDPEHIRYTYNEAFYNCMNLKTVTIAAGLTEEINHSMFERCLNLEKYVISGSGGDYTTMADGAFLVKGNTLICAAQAGIPETIDFTDTGITKIGISAFEGNPDLEPEERKSFSVTNFGSITTIGDSAFNASGITAIGEFGSVTNIGEYAFAYAPLTSISAIKEGMSIGSFAFYNTKLTELTIASAKVKTGGSAFGSSQIAKVTLDFVIDYNDATDYAEYLPDDYDRNGDTNKYSLDYFISRNMLSPWCGFSDVKELVLNKTVNLRDYYTDPTNYDPDDDVYSYTPTTVDGVHYERPFSELYKTLEKLTINGAGSYIGDYQFHKFEKLETVSFGGTNISIGDYAFANTGLGGQTVVINDSITAIGNCAFLNTPAIETSIDGTGTWYYASAKDVWKDAITNSGAGVEEPDWTSIGTVSDAGADIISKIAVTEAPSTSVVYLYNKKAE
ncbi:MAG: leucine-rich repeat protein, partial [Treponema sp.]|nr:leucine-rich repeat protein [Treponema sp.]